MKAKEFLDNERGVVLVISLLILALLIGAGVGAIVSTQTDLRISANLKAGKQAFFLAEAGIERAKQVLDGSNNSFNDELLGSDGTANTDDDGVLGFGSPVTFGAGSYSVKVVDNNDEPVGNPNDPFNDTDTTLFVRSTGTVQNSNRTIEVGLRSSGLFNFAAFGDEGVSLNSNSCVDSYDSRNGAYGGGNNCSAGVPGANRGTKGDVGTNSVSTTTDQQAIRLLSNADIFGDVAVGTGGDSNEAVSVANPSSTISGSKSALASPVDLPEITAPAGCPGATSISLSSNNTETISASGNFDSIVTDSNSRITIDASSDITICTRSLNLRSNSGLDIIGSGTVTIYVLEQLSLDSNTSINQEGRDPTKLAINGTDTLTDVRFDSNADFYGTIYARNANITIDSNADIFGSVIANRVDLSSNAAIHYDEALEDSGSKFCCQVVFWRDLL